MNRKTIRSCTQRLWKGRDLDEYREYASQYYARENVKHVQHGAREKRSISFVPPQRWWRIGIWNPDVRFGENSHLSPARKKTWTAMNLTARCHFHCAQIRRMCHECPLLTISDCNFSVIVNSYIHNSAENCSTIFYFLYARALHPTNAMANKNSNYSQ